MEGRKKCLIKLKSFLNRDFIICTSTSSSPKVISLTEKKKQLRMIKLIFAVGNWSWNLNFGDFWPQVESIIIFWNNFLALKMVCSTKVRSHYYIVCIVAISVVEVVDFCLRMNRLKFWYFLKWNHKEPDKNWDYFLLFKLFLDNLFEKLY